MKKLITLFLILVMLLGATSCGCNPDTTSQKQTDNTETPTGRYILQNGVTDYKIVMPSNNDGFDQSACSELVILFYEATGLNLPVIKDDGLTHNDNNTYLSIGQTTLLATSGISVSKDAQVNNGFQISTKGNTVFFIGGGENGVLFAVYEFLFRTLNFEQFSYDCYSLDTAVLNIELMNYNVVDAPDISLYAAFSGFMNRDRGVCLRMKAPYQFNGFSGTIDGLAGHNTLALVKPSKYNNADDPENYHPEWFSDDLRQLCYTAHGDNESKKLLVKAAVDSFKEYIKQQPDRYYWKITNMDNTSCCTCDACNEYKAQYGCNTAQYYQFMNEFYDNIMAWFKSEEGAPYWDERFMIGISAYEAYEEPPVRKNETTGQYEPIDDSVVLRDRLLLSFAPIHANYLQPLDAPINATHFEVLKKLSAVASRLGIWCYSTDFANFMAPHDVFSSMQKNYQIFQEYGVCHLIDETQNGNNWGMTGFHMLTSYLSAQFAWNTQADQEELIDRFFKGYFLDAADDMKTFFNNWRDFSQLSRNILDPQQGNVYYGTGSKKRWPKIKLDEWQGYVASAMSKIEKYKELNPQKYDMLYKHISMERIFLDFYYLLLYKGNLGSDYMFYANRFAADVQLNKLERWREGKYFLQDFISELYVD